MSQRELSRLEVIQRVCRKALTQRRAADLLSLSVRQVKRLCRAYRRGGAASLISKRRGRPSNHQLRPELVGAARELLRTRYHDFGPTLAHEKLCECHGLSLSTETVRRLMIAEGLWRARRARAAVIRQLRERRARLGELVQLDGSPHDWFEGRAARCVLLNFVDDATSRLMHLSLVECESTFNYFAAVRAYILRRGKPRAFYSDKLGVFRVNMPARAAYTMRGARVEVREAGAGEVSIEYKGRALPFSLHAEQEREQARVVEPKLIDAALSRLATGSKRERKGVALSHPWRGFDYSEKSIAAREKRGELCRLRK